LVSRQTPSKGHGRGGGGGVPDRFGGEAECVGRHAKPSLGGFAFPIQSGIRHSTALAGRNGAGQAAQAFADGVDGARGRGGAGGRGRHVGLNRAVVIWDRDATAGRFAPAGEGCGF